MPSKIKVAMVTRNFPPVIGGIATHVGNLISHLSRLGIVVHVFWGGDDSRTLAMAAALSVRVDDYDILHLKSLPYGAFATFHPLVVTAHSPVLEEAKYYHMAKVLAVFLFEKATLRRADTLITVSQVTAGQLEQLYGMGSFRVKLIPNGVDCERFNPLLKSWDGETRVPMCSRLEPRKNVPEALSAFAHLEEDEFRVDVIGEGPDRTELEKISAMTPKSISFLGALPQKELEEDYSKANIFASTSHSEGFGLSILQAMAAGCAIVASYIPSHRELVVHGQEGLLYSAQSQLIASIQQLVRDKELARQLGKKATEKAQRFSWQSVAAATANVYEELLSESSSNGLVEHGQG